MESPGALPSRGLVFKLVCRFHQYWAYSSKSTVWPKMESCFQDRACSVSSFNLTISSSVNPFSCLQSFPSGASSEESPCQWGDTRDAISIPGSGRSPGVGNGTPLQNSCLGNSMNRGAWGLQSMRPQRVGDDWVTGHCLSVCNGAQVPLEGEFSILDLVGSNQFLSGPMSISFF